MAEKNNETLNIHQKILKIADAAGVLRRSKDAYGYKYVPEEEIQAKVTAVMQKLGVMLYQKIVPGTLKVEPYHYEKYDKKLQKVVPVNEVIVSADSVYTWVNADNPSEQIEVPWAIVGQMEDASQAFGAAETYCNRYFLMKSLQLATTEADPDDYRSKQQSAENYEDEKELKKAQQLLEAGIKEVTEMGSKLMKQGYTKDEIMKVVGKFNDGNQNPSSIKTLDICNLVMTEFKKMAANTENKQIKTTSKKENK